MDTMLKYSVLLVLAMLLSSCSKDDPEHASGIIELPPFNEIQVNSVFHIFLKQDTAFSIQIHGNKEITDEVRYTVENGILTLTNEFRKMWINPEDHTVELYISADQPKKIMVNETSFIETVNPIITGKFGLVTGNKYAEARLELNCDTFYFWNNFPCGGKLTLEGNTRVLAIWNYIIMSVDAGDLTTGYAWVENHSKGDCIVNVKEKLEYSIYGRGNIYLYGKPGEIILKERTGSGELVRME
jgi:hypothetical protein